MSMRPSVLTRSTSTRWFGAWRARDQNDVRSLLTSAAPVDLLFVQTQVKAITDAMEETDRLPALRRLIAEVRPPARPRRRTKPNEKE